jgi:short-subunit dehydrogenase
MDLAESTVLITGASSGIGLELARRFAARARALVLVARRAERLEALRAELIAARPSLTVHVEPCDLGDLTAAERLVDGIAARAGHVDVLVNCAGLGDLSLFERAEWRKIDQMLRLNVVSVAYLTHRLVGPMVARGRGGILNIGSAFGLVFGTGMAAYIGAKHFIDGLSESLRLDLAGTGVTVTHVCPGPVATEFEAHIGNFTGHDAPGLILISAARCAQAAFDGFVRGRALVIPGLMIKFLMLLQAISPRPLVRLFWWPFARALRRKQLAAPPATSAQ